MIQRDPIESQLDARTAALAKIELDRMAIPLTGLPGLLGTPTPVPPFIGDDIAGTPSGAADGVGASHRRGLHRPRFRDSACR